MMARNSIGALEAAATLIEQRGLAKHYPQDFDGRLCSFGAINMATRGVAFGYGNKIGLAAVRRLARHMRMSTWEIVHWNNEPSRTADQVIAAMRAAALKER